MENDNWSLILFTLLAHASAGTIIIGSLALFRSGTSSQVRNKDAAISLAALLMLVTGVAFSFLHLGYPAHSFNALNNIGTSWMSMEILCILLLAGALSIWFFGSLIKKRGVAATSGNWLSFILAVSLVFIMGMVYSLPAMNTPGRGVMVISFLSASLFFGTALVWIMNIIPGGRIKPGLPWLLPIFLLASFLNSAISINNIHEGGFIHMLITILYLLALGPSVLFFFTAAKNKWVVCGVIIITLGIIAEILNRYMILNFSIAGL